MSKKRQPVYYGGVECNPFCNVFACSFSSDDGSLYCSIHKDDPQLESLLMKDANAQLEIDEPTEDLVICAAEIATLLQQSPPTEQEVTELLARNYERICGYPDGSVTCTIEDGLAFFRLMDTQRNIRGH